ncbi:MAG: hypothetical protein ABIQ35_13745 [Verrucomicrobiota bacterium]
MLFASIESFFIFLLIAGASALFNWIKKRRENSDISTDDPLPRTRRDPPPSGNSPPSIQRPGKPSTNWEEELRRMLEGAVPTTRTPPPIVIPERRFPVSRPPIVIEREQPTMSVPAIFQETKYYKAHCNHCGGHIEFPASSMEEVTSCPHCHQATVLRPFENTTVEALAHKNVLTEFNASTRSYQQASQLSQRVSAHMHGVGHHAVGLTSTQTTKRIWPEVAETKALFKNSRSVRQAMIASLIFGPPKALEN